MGYSYGRTASGAMALSCDNCGHVGGVRRRRCPHTVLADSRRGSRHELRFCPSPALCADCFTKLSGTGGVHAECAEGTRRAQEDYDAIERALDEGESFAISAYGDYHLAVPASMVGMTFQGPGRPDPPPRACSGVLARPASAVGLSAGAAMDTTALTGHRARHSAHARTRPATRTRTRSTSLTGQAQQQDTRSACA